MGKTAFIFPGQGAQVCGMGQDFYEHTETGRKIFDRASEILGFSMPELCFEKMTGWISQSIPIDGVQVANYNCPGQIVISGSLEAVAQAAEQLKAAGAKRVLPLNISGPFHSALLKEAGEKLGKFLENVKISDPVIPYAANVTAEYVTRAEEVKPLLERQVYSSVKWQQSVERMIADGVDRFVEIGPGKTLTGFVKKISRDVKAVNIEKLDDLEKLKEL